MKIYPAHIPNHIDQVRALFREYEAFLHVDLCFQSFEQELACLPGKYAPPEGALFLALEDEIPAGCVALRKFKEGNGEMKRLFVRPAFRGRGLGRILAERIIAEAVQLGYGCILLDTLDRLKAAMRLYESLGFVKTEPYYPNPLPDVVYWKLDLNKFKK
jgi:GNAT superfamily N-acetyltransferase